MAETNTALAIVNRSFQFDSPIGEGLLQFAELAVATGSVCVITQADDDLQNELEAAGRGRGIHIRACKAYTTSASGLLKRIAEAILFMIWTFISLVRARPTNVYVATNPPVVVPFIVALYCRLVGARYVYHLQDIHPEAANIVVPVSGILYRLLQAVDNYTLRHASAIITLSEDMKAYILQRSDTRSPIYLLDNPSFEVAPAPLEERTQDIVFCGNAGRLQRIPLLLAAIRDYLEQGGKMHFTFAGGGVHASDVRALADAYDQVNYLGVIPAADAAELVNLHRWALLPIDDEVTKYAFPSKSSGYALSGAGILTVCGESTSVARWVVENKVGVVCVAEHTALVRCLFSLEDTVGESFLIDSAMRDKLQIPYFAQKLYEFALAIGPGLHH